MTTVAMTVAAQDEVAKTSPPHVRKTTPQWTSNAYDAADLLSELGAPVAGLGSKLSEFKQKYASPGKATGGPWDIKKIDKKLERYGNVAFGYLGRVSGIAEALLRIGAGRAQAGQQSWGNDATDEYWADDPNDYGFVTMGIRSYDEGIEP